MKFEKYRRLTLRGFVILALAAAIVAGTCVTSNAIEIEIDVSGGNGGNGGNGGSIEIGIDPALKPKPQPPASSSSSKPEAPSSKPETPSSKPAASSASSKPAAPSSVPEANSESPTSSEGASENKPAPTKLGDIGPIEVYSDTGLFLPLLKTLQLDLLSDTVYPADRLQKLFSK